MTNGLNTLAKRVLPRPVKTALRVVRKLAKEVLPRPVKIVLRVVLKDGAAVLPFVTNGTLPPSFNERLQIARKLVTISNDLPSPHTQDEVLAFIQTILSLPRDREGVLVEAGRYKGSSTAKFSLAARIAGRKLVVFDSFQGIPENDEQHVFDIHGESAGFKRGDFCGALEEVKSNVERYGDIEPCRFIQGWFDDTMPRFGQSISAAYLDVDLVSSTRTCLKHLYPLLEEGGVLYSQDGHLPLVIGLFNDDDFWLKEVGCRKPNIEGLGERKLIRIVKEARAS